MIFQVDTGITVGTDHPRLSAAVPRSCHLRVVWVDNGVDYVVYAVERQWYNIVVTTRREISRDYKRR